MRDGVRLLVLSHTVFVAMLILSGSVSGIVGEIIYYLAFVLPLAIGIYGSGKLKEQRERLAGVGEAPTSFFALKPRELLKLAPLVFPVVCLVFMVSFLTSLFMGLFGMETAEVIDTGFFRMLLVHALVPSVTEELVFRLLPMMLILPYSPRCCVIVSSVTFSLCHCDLFKMPYAFAAGFAFMLIDIMAGSVIPSMVLYFVNNAVSVGWIILAPEYRFIFVLSLVALALISLIFVFVLRREYREKLKAAWQKGEGFMGGREVALIALLTLLISVTNLL